MVSAKPKHHILDYGLSRGDELFRNGKQKFYDIENDKRYAV